MIVDAVIPARMDSSRFPGKPLARIQGKSMIERVYRRVEAAACFRRIVVATDHEAIAGEVERFGGEWCMTAAGHRSGTDRVLEAVGDQAIDAVVNIQGDEPLIQPQLIRDVTAALSQTNSYVVTAAYRGDSREDFFSPHVVKVVLDRDRRALYFSRAPIPWPQDPLKCEYLQHVGIYALRLDMLRQFVSWPPGVLETRERLEQLRFLENGVSIYVVDSPEPAFGVDVPEDIARIEARLGGENR
ncbi:MAG: 3-deoxy-manno-octulosonate cytidylyltransferase [Acidobacteriota bacterium]|nr:3-deoxy-manno-octulosonate cytidylyltransferase [Acidobacteriota bacterium]